MGLNLYDFRYDWPIYLGVGLIILLIILFVFMVIDYVSGEVRTERVMVVQTFYEPASTGVGVTSTSNGGAGPVVVSNRAKYNLLLEFNDGRRSLVKTNKVSLAMSDPGTEYKFHCRYGGISGDLIRCDR